MGEVFGGGEKFNHPPLPLPFMPTADLPKVRQGRGKLRFYFSSRTTGQWSEPMTSGRILAALTRGRSLALTKK